jgi:predicted alpha/beta-hydrolase family hydrolase
MDSPFMATIATGLAELGWRVVRFEFPYMARSRLRGRRSAPDRPPVLLDAFRRQVARERDGRPLIIGGKSMGGRLASLLADELAVQGCLCLGFPFHPPGRPQQWRGEHLEALRTPTLILQGERDSFGPRRELEGARLSSQVRLVWLPAGDHGFRPSRASGLAEADNLRTAIAHADRFLHGLTLA